MEEHFKCPHQAYCYWSAAVFKAEQQQHRKQSASAPSCFTLGSVKGTSANATKLRKFGQHLRLIDTGVVDLQAQAPAANQLTNCDDECPIPATQVDEHVVLRHSEQLLKERGKLHLHGLVRQYRSSLTTLQRSLAVQRKVALNVVVVETCTEEWEKANLGMCREKEGKKMRSEKRRSVLSV